VVYPFRVKYWAIVGFESTQSSTTLQDVEYYRYCVLYFEKMVMELQVYCGAIPLVVPQYIHGDDGDGL